MASTLSRDRHDSGQDVAIIGMSCRLPGANQHWELWRKLEAGVGSVVEIPSERWDRELYYSPDPDAPNRARSKWGGFAEDVDKFDASFFQISPREAELMDPQQRLMLELTWGCLEDAGYAPQALRGAPVGVFLGVCNFDYKELLEKSLSPIEGHLSTGAYHTLIPNRVSYEFDFRGPSVPVDTACASSLIALHQAVHALRQGECSMALVGGISVLCSPTYFVGFSKAGMLSPDGLCRTFDRQANGYVRGEGAGLVLLKPLDRALADGDRIWSVVKGTAQNHGGKVAAVTHPNPMAQAEVIASALRAAGLTPDSVSYVEAHGTGTPKGDPIEVLGLQRAYLRMAEESGLRLEPNSCGLGTIKTNIGHLEAAAGIAGLIKLCLSMQRRQLPPLVNYAELNPRIDFAGSPFHVVDTLREWSTSALQPLRRAGISGFGFGGVNAHAVLEEFVQPELQHAEGVQLFVLSARTSERLQVYAQRLLAHLKGRWQAELPLARIASTLQGRQSMDERVAFLASSHAELKDKLAALARSVDGFRDGHRGDVRSGATSIASYCEGGTRASMVQTWLREANLTELMPLWCRGLSVDWCVLWTRAGGLRPRVVSLPTYPFERRRHWLPQPSDMRAVFKPLEGPSSEASAALTVSPWVELVSRWQAQPLVESHARSPLHERCLFVTLLSAESERALSGLTSVALAAPESSGLASSWTEACWRSMERLRDALRVHQPTGLRFLSQTEPGFADVAYALLQSVAKELGLPLHWSALDDSLVLDAALLQRLLADAPTALGSSASRLRREAGQLVCEQRRWSAMPLTGRAQKLQPTQREVYWLTGGAGGIGLKLADHLASEYDATVILSGRSSLQTSGRDGLLASRKSRRGRVFYRSADCTKRSDMESVLAWILDHHERLSSVVHAAGTLRDKSLFFKTRADVLDVLRPKLEGAWLLDELTREVSLDSFVLFSSIAGLFGNAGQSDYAAANAYLSQLAHQRRALRARGQRHGDSLVLHWPYWQGGGMRLTDALAQQLEQGLGFEALSDQAGLAIFEHVMSVRPDEACFVTGDAARIEARLNGIPESTPVAAPTVVAPTATDDARRVESVDAEPSMIRYLTDLVASLTGLSAAELDRDAHFVEHGVDSIMLQTMVRRVNERFGLKVSVLELHDHPSIDELAAHLEGLRAKTPELAAAPSLVSAPRSVVTLQVSEPVAREQDVAIIGIDLKLPGAETLEQLWQLLTSRPRPAESYPEERWRRLPAELTQGSTRESCAGFFLPDVLAFDHVGFGISPREAMLMDPQQRLLLESVRSAFLDAGYDRAQVARSRTSTFVAIDTVDYEQVSRFDPVIDEYSATGVSRYIAANRISHVFNLCGLSEPVSTACSGFYVGLARALEALQSGSSDQAVVAAVQVNLLPSRFRMLRERQLLSSSPFTLPFAARGDGFVRSEGVGSVILKPLARALAAGDPIYGVIKGAGVWHGGTAMGVAAPNPAAHQQAIQLGLARSGVAADRVGLVELHGTAMRLGDDSELSALAAALQTLGRDPGRPACLVGAAKGVLGHLEAASGVAALAKTLLSLDKGIVPGLSHLGTDDTSVHPSSLLLPRHEQTFAVAPDGQPRCAGLHAYGLGGVSAFVVVEQARAGRNVERQARVDSRRGPRREFWISAPQGSS